MPWYITSSAPCGSKMPGANTYGCVSSFCRSTWLGEVHREAGTLKPSGRSGVVASSMVPPCAVGPASCDGPNDRLNLFASSNLSKDLMGYHDSEIESSDPRIDSVDIRFRRSST